MQFGFALPSVIRESYLCVDGQEAESAAGCSEGLFFGLKLLPLEDVLQEWRFWREVDDDPMTGANDQLRQVMQSIPPGWVRKEYSQRGWIPLIADKVGNYVGVDLNPDEGGTVGQVIVFGRDFDTKVVLWRGDGQAGWAKWLASFVEELEGGEGYELGTGGNEGSEDSEDDLGYESYFYDGTGRGQGDGGGDVGAAGLRLAGEYRGWNVLEAWADRSLRRWHEAGVITDTSLLPPEEEEKTKVPDPLVLDVTHQSSPEVGIPVLADVDDPIPAPSVSPALGQLTNMARAGPSTLPTISVTRPPAPLPVALPEPQDILHSTPPESSSFDHDLESGRSSGMREVSNFVSRSKPLPQATQASAGSSRPISPPVVASSNATDRSKPQKKPTIPDLLADSAPAMDTQPIAPSSPATSQVEATPTNAVLELHDDAEDPNTTIRLIGGGGVVGTVDTGSEVEVTPTKERDSDAVSVSSVVSTSEKGTKTHKKMKSSLVSLKKFGNLRRKRDSGSSVKSTDPESPVLT